MENMVNTKHNKQYWKNRKVVVTGHEGFLGSWLTKVLVENGANVIGIDKVERKSLSVLNNVRKKIKCVKGNIANYKLLKDVIEMYKPKTIFHLAAEAIIVTANKNPINTFKSNIQGTWNILEISKNNNFIENIVVASSDKAYGSHDILPYTEDAALKGDHPYDASKSCADLICRTYFRTFNVPVCVTRCGNIYGPGDTNFSRIVPDTIRHLIKNKQFVIRSNGKFIRDYIYVEDIVNAYLVLAEKMLKLKLSGEAFNFSCGKPVSVLALYKKILKAYGEDWIEPKILNQAKFEIKDQYLSSKKAKRVLKWKPNYSVEEGLKKTIAWYKEKIK